MFLGGAAVLVGAVEMVLVVAEPVAPVWQLVLFLLVAWTYLAAGIVAWWRRPSNRMGAIMVAGCFALLVAGLANMNGPGLIAVGTVGATVILALLVHLLHAFPSGRLHGAASRLTVLAGYGVSVILQAPLYLFTAAPPPYDVLMVSDRPDVANAGAWVQRVAGAAVVVVTVVILAQRLRRADPARRQVLVPLFTYGIVAVLFIPVSSSLLQPLLGFSLGTLTMLQLVVIGGVPITFALGVLRGGFARTGEVEELGTWLGVSGGARPTLDEALAQTLGDPSLQLAFWASDRNAYVDAAGRSVELPSPGSDRAVAEVDLEGRPVGAIIYDATLIGDPELVRAAGRVVAIAVDRERLTAQLLASEGALRRSRERLVEAGDRERRRVARDLHDGMQGRLVLLALEAQRIAGHPTASERVIEAATSLRAGIDDAAGELRRLVHAVMPASLIERGLSAATEDLVDHVPVPTRLELGVEDGALSPAVESTAYCVVAEALTNAVKHSHAHELAVRLALADGLLLIEIDDDGVGGARPGRGVDLRSLADRVDVLGGRLRVDSPPGRGTHLVAELPCAS
jgi:signal transduction histidine kinase